MLTLQNNAGDRLPDIFEVSDNEKEAGYFFIKLSFFLYTVSLSFIFSSSYIIIYVHCYMYIILQLKSSIKYPKR